MTSLSVSLVSPSSSFDNQLLKDSLRLASTLGIKIVSATETRLGQPAFINGTKGERLAELLDADQQATDAIWCVRGGCGAIELIHDYVNIPVQGPILIGYSDSTVLHFLRFYRSQRLGIHGPIFFELSNTERACFDQIRLLVKDRAEQLVYPPLKALNNIIFDQISGPLLPMNLTSLQSLIGCFDPGFLHGKIVAIEDINEPAYKVWRTVQHLKNAQVLFGLKALVIGHFNLDRAELVEHTFKPLAHDLGIPLFDWPIFGHDQPNWPLLFGARGMISRVDGHIFTWTYLE